MKNLNDQVDALCEQIATKLNIHPDEVDLSLTVGGYLADVNLSGIKIRGDVSTNEISALESLLEKSLDTSESV